MLLNGDKSWLDVEMEETVTLLRKKLETLNDIPVDDLDGDDVKTLEKIYRTLTHIMCLSKK